MQIVINGIKVVFDFPWLVLGSKELDPAEVSALERALSTSAGRRYLEQFTSRPTSKNTREEPSPPRLRLLLRSMRLRVPERS
jgi:hypothetical protein